MSFLSLKALYVNFSLYKAEAVLFSASVICAVNNIFWLIIECKRSYSEIFLWYTETDVNLAILISSPS